MRELDPRTDVCWRTRSPTEHRARARAIREELTLVLCRRNDDLIIRLEETLCLARERTGVPQIRRQLRRRTPHDDLLRPALYIGQHRASFLAPLNLLRCFP